MSINRQDKGIYAGLLFLALIMISASSYNPFNPRLMHVDSSVFITVSRGITRGQLPYRDFVDNKGPLTYLIGVPGLLLGGFTGIWVTEFILIFVSVIFAYKIALFFTDKYKAFLGTVFSFIVLLSFFFLYAGTEEYSLPFSMISLYIFTKYHFAPKQEVRFPELVVLGICFSCAIMIRLNMFPLWAGFCLPIFVESVIRRRFMLLGKYILGFSLGIIIIFTPLFLYLKLNGIFDACIEQMLIGGAARGFSETNLKSIVLNFFRVFNRTYSAIPFCLGLFWTITGYKQGRFTYYLGYTVSYFLMILFLSFSSGDEHFNVVLIPFFVPVLAFFTGIVHTEFAKTGIKNAVTVLFFCVILTEGIARYTFNLSKVFFADSGKKSILAGKMIDENTRQGDKIISLGYNAYIYPFTQREAASKYFYQGAGINQIPGSRDAFIADILTSKPAVIVIYNAEPEHSQIIPDWHGPVLELMDKEYRLFSDEYGYMLFKRISDVT